MSVVSPYSDWCVLHRRVFSGRADTFRRRFDMFTKFPRSEVPVLCRVMHARPKENDTVSKPNFAVQIIEMSGSFGFTLCTLPRGAVGI